MRVNAVGIVMAGLVLSLASRADASLIMVGVPGPDLNNSVQASTRVLELSHQGDESGCIQINGAGFDVSGVCWLGFAGGDEQPQSQTRTAGTLGIADGADLRIVMDAVEPGGNGITLNDLRVVLQNPTTGALIFSADLVAPIVLPTTLTGTGKSDMLLRLDGAQAAALDAAVAVSGVALSNVRIGLLANLSASAGGPEAFYVGDAATFDPGDPGDPGGPGDPVPEPGTLLMMGAGVTSLVMRRRRVAEAREDTRVKLG